MFSTDHCNKMMTEKSRRIGFLVGIVAYPLTVHPVVIGATEQPWGRQRQRGKELATILLDEASEKTYETIE